MEFGFFAYQLKFPLSMTHDHSQQHLMAHACLTLNQYDTHPKKIPIGPATMAS